MSWKSKFGKVATEKLDPTFFLEMQVRSKWGPSFFEKVEKKCVF